MGRAYKFGDNIDTDLIVPGEYLSLIEKQELAKVCMEGYERGFSSKLKKGDIFVAGKNFGCGSSREHAPISIFANGITCVIAESFARIFYRNSINIGLPVLESYEAATNIVEGDDVSVNFSLGIIYNNTKNVEYRFNPFPEEVFDIINSGGLQNYFKNRNKKI